MSGTGNAADEFTLRVIEACSIPAIVPEVVVRPVETGICRGPGRP